MITIGMCFFDEITRLYPSGWYRMFWTPWKSLDTVRLDLKKLSRPALTGIAAAGVTRIRPVYEQFRDGTDPPWYGSALESLWLAAQVEQLTGLPLAVAQLNAA